MFQKDGKMAGDKKKEKEEKEKEKEDKDEKKVLITCIFLLLTIIFQTE